MENLHKFLNSKSDDPKAWFKILNTLNIDHMEYE